MGIHFTAFVYFFSKQNCPMVIYDLMLLCWNKDHTKRPRMVEIRNQLEKWIRSPDLLKTTNNAAKKKYVFFSNT